MMKKSNIWIIGLGMLLAACSSADEEATTPKSGVLKLTTSVSGFENIAGTRTNLEGNAFVNGDKIKLKIICPYSPRTENGETNWGGSSDSFWLLKWNGAWTTLDKDDEIDISGQYSYSDGNNVFGQYEAQNTPYVYTASTWNENVIFLAPNDGGSNSRYSQYSYIFHADQSEQKNYQNSDLLWTQTYMQTGSYNVHLAFNHVMACLKFYISGVTLSDDAVVTLEGMPDIDQMEVVVGDYYAAASKSNSKYGYKEKCSCEKAKNGLVLGVAAIDDSQKKAVVKSIENTTSVTEITNTGVYTAYRNGDYFYLIVPPCSLSANAKVWIRDGSARYNYTLQHTTFEQGKLYPVNITISQ